MIPKIGPLELVVILVVVLLIFGPKNLPKLGSALGKSVKNMREGLDSGKKESDDKKADDKKKADAKADKKADAKAKDAEVVEEEDEEPVVDKPAPKSRRFDDEEDD